MWYSKSLQERLKTKYGSWALVTGASSGIGRELTLRLAEAGLNVVLSARRKDVLQELADDITTAYKVKTHVVVADMSKHEGVEHLIEASKHLDIGLLVANAGVGTSGLFFESTLDDEIDLLRINCEAVLMLTHFYSKEFANRGGGGIILMSSIVGFQGTPYAANYAASKAYVQSLAEALNVELKALNIDVLAAAPGPVNSNFASNAGMVMDKALEPSDVAVPIVKALGKKSTVFPAMFTKILVAGLRTVPRWGKIRIMKHVMGGMTKHNRTKL